MLKMVFLVTISLQVVVENGSPLHSLFDSGDVA